MKQEQIMKYAFIASVISVVIAATLKIMHTGGTEIFFIAAVVAAVIWTVLALMEIYGSSRLETTEKIMWTVGFLFFNMLAGILYFLSGRQRVIDRRSHFNIQN